MTTSLQIGFIPLIDAAGLIIAVEKGFIRAEGLEAALVREVSWSNVRDKLNIGLFDTAHLLAPVPIASSLGLGHIKVPIVAPLTLSLNGNAITVSRALHAAISAEIEGDPLDPMATAQALSRVVARRRHTGRESLTFGMTFPFSTHNYQLRFWMAAGGIDPDEDVRLVVLPPPFMVDSIADGQIDGFCVGAPWNSIAVERGVGDILHFGSEIMQRAAEKVLAARKVWAEKNPQTLAALVRAVVRGADFAEAESNRVEVARILARDEYVGVDADVIIRTLEGRLKIASDGTVRQNDRHLLLAREDASIPDPVQAAWLYAQMVRWRQTPMSAEGLKTAEAVFRSDLYHSAFGRDGKQGPTSHPVSAFAGPAFDAKNIQSYLAALQLGRDKREDPSR
jgi:two-component system, oxyanion-binding sensor